jgi:stage III sporulation protein AD
MDLFRVIAIALVTAVTAIVLKSVKPELAFAAVLAGVIILLCAALDMFQEAFSLFDDLAALTGIDNALVKILLKIVGVGYLTEFAGDLLVDFGSASLAKKVELCGKITIFILSVPILKVLLSLIVDFLALL